MPSTRIGTTCSRGPESRTRSPTGRCFAAAMAFTFSVDMERELPWNLVADIGYVGNQTRHLPVNGVQLNAPPVSELSRPDSYYAEQVPNPMAGLLPHNASLNGARIQRRFLLVPFP